MAIAQRSFRPEMEDDPILVRCPKCHTLRQPPNPIGEGLVQDVAQTRLEAECPNHPWPEVIED